MTGPASTWTDTQIESARARVESRRESTAHFRAINRADWAVPNLKVRAPRTPRTTVAPTAQIRPCPTCGLLTRPSHRPAADNPGTLPRGAGDVCTRCIAKAKRTTPERVLNVLDVPAAVELYLSGVSATEIGRRTRIDVGSVTRSLVAAGVTMRNRSQARLALLAMA